MPSEVLPVHAAIGVGSDVDQQLSAVLHGHLRCAREVDAEVHDRDRIGDLPAVVVPEGVQVSVELGVDLAGDVEERKRRLQDVAVLGLVLDALPHLAQAHLSVAVGVEQIEVDVDAHAAAHAAAGDAQIELGRSAEPAVELDLGNVRGTAVVVVHIEAVHEIERIAVVVGRELADAQGVVTESELDVGADVDADAGADGPHDREELAPFEVELKRSHRVVHEGRIAPP